MTTAKMYTYDGRTLTLPEWAKSTGVNIYTLRYRLDKGCSLEEAITKPIGKNGRETSLTYNGKTATVREWASELGLSTCTIADRLRKKLPIERVLTSELWVEQKTRHLSQRASRKPTPKHVAAPVVAPPSPELVAEIEARTLRAEAVLDRFEQPAPAPAATKRPHLAVTLDRTGMSGADAVSLLYWAQERNISLTLSVEART